MKKQSLWQLMVAVVVVLSSVGFVSCSLDDDGDSKVTGGDGLTTPKYEKESALYTVQSQSGDAPSIYSIELTASGDYAVIYDDVVAGPYSANPANRHMKFIPVAKPTRVATLENVVHGKYTKIDENTYHLDGWGIVTVTGSAGSAVSITVTPEGSDKPYTVTAAKQNQQPNSSLTNKICRTWSINGMRIVIEFMGKRLFDKEYTMDQYPKQMTTDLMEWAMSMSDMFDDDDDDDYYYDDDDGYYDGYLQMIEDIKPVQIIFTKAGSYMVKYANETLAVSTWSWTDESKGILRYSWDYTSMEEWNIAGYVKVSFRGDRLLFSESSRDKVTNSYGDDDDNYYEPNVITVYYLDEAK